MRRRHPSLGAGIGLRREHYEALPETARALDWVEITPENHMRAGGRARRALDRCRERWPVVPHGVSLNLGGLEPLDPEYLEDLRRLCAALDAPFFTDHLCYSRVEGVYLHDLLPLPFNEAAVDHVVPRAREAQERVGRRLLLENATYYAVMPGQTLGEAAFLTAVLEQADCGLLLDVNNVHVNARNHGYDPVAFIDALPLDRVAQVHLAGHEVGPHMLVDTHEGPVPEPVWALYEHVLSRVGPVSTLVEWDQDVPGVEEVLAQADRARALLAAADARRVAGVR
ncbi:MAG: DUF692 domain-containing protein [Planctomycetes bacterium]|nr:DUF692 domain-containing protein [Planctomycetota bacterium]